VALSRATGAHVMEGGVLRYSGTAAELESRPERLQSAYLLRGSPIKPGDALGAAALDGPVPDGSAPAVDGPVLDGTGPGGTGADATAAGGTVPDAAGREGDKED
jgi:hypothetical protein